MVQVYFETSEFPQISFSDGNSENIAVSSDFHTSARNRRLKKDLKHSAGYHEVSKNWGMTAVYRTFPQLNNITVAIRSFV